MPPSSDLLRPSLLSLALASAPARAAEDRPADEARIDAVLARARALLSAPAGIARDWDAFRALFAPDARIIVNERGPDGSVRSVAHTVDDYIADFERRFGADGFFAEGRGRRVEIFGRLAYVFAAFEAHHRDPAAPAFICGCNSAQLVFDGTHWRILNLFVEPRPGPAGLAPATAPRGLVLGR